MGGRKLTTLSHEVKREICRDKQKNPTLTAKELSVWVSYKFHSKVHETTIGRVLKKSYALLSNVTSNSTKRAKNPQNPAVKEALYRWFLTAQEARLSISDDLLMEKGKSMFDILKQKDASLSDCKFSSGWLIGFKKRHNISLRVLHGEANSVELTEGTWEQFHALKAALSAYDDCDVFNMDETGLFLKLQPNKTLRDREVAGQKKSKDRITVALTANRDGSMKLPALVINKSLMPQAFSQCRIKRPDNLGIQWFSNKKAWMTGVIFQEWLLQFDRHMKAVGRSKVALVLDNAPGHLLGPLAEKLEVTKVFFLPANTTARFQPMDAGIINSFKCQYRRQLIKKQLSDFEKGETFKFDLYEVVLMVVRAWNEGVTAKTIRACWEHYDLMPYRDRRAGRVCRDLDLTTELRDDDSEDAILDLSEQLQTLSLTFPVTMDVEEYLQVDCVENAPTFPVDADIEQFLVDRMPEDEAEVPDDSESQIDPELTQDVEDEIVVTVARVTFAETMTFFEGIKTFLQQQEYDTYSLANEISKVIRVVEREHMRTFVQSNIEKFFQHGAEDRNEEDNDEQNADDIGEDMEVVD